MGEDKKIFANDISHKCLIPKKCKELIELNIQKTTISLNIRQRRKNLARSLTFQISRAYKTYKLKVNCINLTQ